ncbi:MAG: hypothetical protein KDA72_09775 [Planctomycetales bacterium]|nr:hypothetical protein [Planctomycetales bacterium]
MTTDHSQEKKLINMLAIEAAELWLQRFEKIQDAKAPNQNNAGIHVEIGRIDSRFHTAYWSLYSSLAQHIEGTVHLSHWTVSLAMAGLIV